MRTTGAWNQTSFFWVIRLNPDSLLQAVFETQLQFGIAMDHGFKPTIH
jgi:hypothetical protein